MSWVISLRFYFMFLERERKGGINKERERNIDEWEKHQLAASHTHSNRAPACKSGVCRDGGPNRQCCTLWDDAQPTEPCQSWRDVIFLLFMLLQLSQFYPLSPSPQSPFPIVSPNTTVHVHGYVWDIILITLWIKNEKSEPWYFQKYIWKTKI